MDSLECYILDLVDCYNDLINENLPCFLTTVAAVVVMILCALKMACGRQMRRFGYLEQNSQASHAQCRNTYLNQNASQISYANTVPTSAGTGPRKRESELRDRGGKSSSELDSALDKKQGGSKTASSQKSGLANEEGKVTGYEESIEPASLTVSPSFQKKSDSGRLEPNGPGSKVDAENRDGSGKRRSTNIGAMGAKPNTLPTSTPVDPLVTQSSNSNLEKSLVKHSSSGNLLTPIIKVRYSADEDIPEALLSADDDDVTTGKLYGAKDFDYGQNASCTCEAKRSKLSKKLSSGQRGPCNKSCDCYKNDIKNMGSVIIRRKRSPRSLSPKRSKMGQHSKTRLKKETSCCSACCVNCRGSKTTINTRI